jgi:hypothetical protein
MTDHSVAIRCSRCGETSSGRFCSNCGAPLRDVKCESCGHVVPAGGRFCAECGTPLGAAAGGASAPAAGAASRTPDRLARLIGGAALLVLIAFVLGQSAARRSAGSGGATDQPATTPLAGTASGPDISSMSPEERASRLFNRVMTYSENGKMDSARFFAPMAIQAYQMIGPVDAHVRYDIGAIAAAVGDVARARAEADTILAGRPNHLLGLVLAIRAADLSNDAAAAARIRQQLVRATPAERAAGLKEYTEHARDIDEALNKAAGSPR